MAGTKLGERLSEARKASELELLIVRGVRLLAEGDMEEDAAAEVGSAARSRRTAEAQGVCIAAAALGLATSADAVMEMIQLRYVELLAEVS